MTIFTQKSEFKGQWTSSRGDRGTGRPGASGIHGEDASHRIGRDSSKQNRKATWSPRMLFSFFVGTLPTVWCLMAISLLFKRIYRYQSHDYAFSSVEKLLHSLGGDDYLGLFNRSLLETLQKAGFSEKFLDEIITPVMRVNYGQTTNINGFVGKSGLGIVNGH